MNQIEALKKLLSAKTIKIKNLELENKKLKQQLSKTHAQLKTERQQHKITHAEIKKAKRYIKQLEIKTQRLIAKEEAMRKSFIKAAGHGSFDSWSSVKKGYNRSAKSALNRLSKKYPKLYKDLTDLVNQTSATREQILKIVWDIYAVRHSGMDADVYETDPEYVDDDGAQDLFFALKINYGKEMPEGWLEY